MVELDLENMSDDELYELIEDAQAVLGKRQTAEVFEAKIAEVVKEGRAAGIVETPEQGDEWQQNPPGGYYTLNDVVTDNGRVYRSNLAVNVYRPHDPNDPQTWRWWVDITDGEPGTQEDEHGNLIWSGEGVNYAAGDERAHEGELYRALQDHVSQPTWAPGVAHSLWEHIGPVEAPEPDEGETETETDPNALPEWEVGLDYAAGDTFLYNGDPYRVLQSHTSQSNWLPDQVPALYERGTIVS